MSRFTDTLILALGAALGLAATPACGALRGFDCAVQAGYRLDDASWDEVAFDDDVVVSVGDETVTLTGTVEGAELIVTWEVAERGLNEDVVYH